MLELTPKIALPMAAALALTACGTEFDRNDAQVSFFEADRSAASSSAICAKIERHCERRNLTTAECNELLETRDCPTLEVPGANLDTDFDLNPDGWNLDIGTGLGTGDSFGHNDTNMDGPDVDIDIPSLESNDPGLRIPPYFENDETGDNHRNWVRELDTINYDGYTPWRFIGIKADPAAPCPQANGNFTTRALFGDDQGSLSGLADHLAKYCLYTAPIGSVNFSQTQIPAELQVLTNINGASQLLTIEPDHLSITGSSATLATEFRPSFLEETYEHTGKMAQHSTKTLGWWIGQTYESYCPWIEQSYPQYYALLCANFQAAPTRVALVDSSPTRTDAHDAAAVHGHSRHGHGLANLAENLLCDGVGTDVNQTCVGKVSTQMAMPFLIDGGLQEDPINGGDFGSISWLAEGIFREVREWRNLPADQRGRLVLNLSLGWSPEYGGDPAGAADCNTPENPACDWPNDVKTVFAAINHAQCSGALVIAAAGNETGGPAYNEGALLPGLWETLPRPTDCSRWATAQQQDPSLANSTASYEPLLYAASGIDYKGDDIAIARDGGRARLAAYADHVVASPKFNSESYTDTLTGTSVSTTVLASAAAAVWFYRPDLSLHEVMEIIYNSGSDIMLVDENGVAYNAEADFCLGGVCGETRRINVCEATVLACQTSPSVHNPCPTNIGAFGACSGWDKNPIDMDQNTIDDIAAVADQDTELSYTEVTGGAAIAVKQTLTCGAAKLTTLEEQDGVNNADQADCPKESAYGIGARPWTAPQPFGGPCTDCAMSVNTSMLTLTGISNFSNYTSPTLSVKDTAGITTKYSLGSLSGMSISISMPNLNFGSLKSATFSGIGSGGSSVSDSLYIEN